MDRTAYRDYGRFGSYFQDTLAPHATAKFKARFHISPGALPETAREQMGTRYAAYLNDVD